MQFRDICYVYRDESQGQAPALPTLCDWIKKGLVVWSFGDVFVVSLNKLKNKRCHNGQMTSLDLAGLAKRKA